VRDGDRASAWRVVDGKLERVTIDVGPRDPRSGDFVISSGLSEGDRVLRYPSALLKDGQRAEPKATAPASTRAPAAPASPPPAKG